MQGTKTSLAGELQDEPIQNALLAKQKWFKRFCLVCFSASGSETFHLSRVF
jgi:hypothetical protein